MMNPRVSARVLDDHAVFHDQREAGVRIGEHAQIPGGIAVDQQQIRPRPDGDFPESGFPVGITLPESRNKAALPDVTILSASTLVKYSPRRTTMSLWRWLRSGSNSRSVPHPNLTPCLRAH